MHQIDYAKAPKAYFFALNTYIAVVAKVCAVYALASRSPEVLHPSPDPILFLKSIEEGEYFRQFGIGLAQALLERMRREEAPNQTDRCLWISFDAAGG